MPRTCRRLPSSLLFASLAIALSLPAAAETPASVAPLEGWLTIVWGDATADGPLTQPHRKVFLTDDLGTITELEMSDELLRGGVFAWNGRRIAVYARPGASALPTGRLAVAAIELREGRSALGGVTGSQPWISLLCKFSDIGAEPENLAFFQGMYANSPAGLDHYWREVSDDAIDIVGSIAVDWVTLPGTQISYAPTPGSNFNADLDRVFEDCTAAVDPIVDFSRGGDPYAGINIMVNDVLDCCAWGGGRFATLDGVSKVWRTTWNPPWAFRNEGVIAHEMGHGFGLPHANNFDGDDNPYDSPWDVMSSATGYSVNDSTYGALGKHVNAYHKDQLGWFPASQRFEAPDNSSTSIVLDHTALQDATNYKIAVVRIDATRWYTVEARVRSGDYELRLPGDAVIIHAVDTNRSEPSWAVDAAQPPANFGDNPGTMWTVGETFTDAANSISVSVDFATPNGFGVTVNRGDAGLIFRDGFESGDLSAWSGTTP
ncbi:MAG: hypothetical protein AAGM22_28900 [Acidobacteriota bacterium]